MKHLRITFVCLTLFFAINNTLCQNWEWQHPKPQGNGLIDICFIDENTGWAVGDYGTLMKTEDGGQNWSLKVFPSKAIIHKIYFIDHEKGFAGTDAKELYYTHDGGAHWTILDIGNKYAGDMYFLDAEVGFMIGYEEVSASGVNSHILQTQDGGLSWSEQYVIEDNWIRGICIVDNAHGWACGEKGLILYTNNAGQDWQEKSFEVDIDLDYISFTDSQIGWAAGSRGEYPAYESVIYHTSDGGASWTEHTVFADVIYVWFEFADDNTAFLYGIYGLLDTNLQQLIPIIYVTHDGGLSWESNELDYQEIFFGRFILDSMNIWITVGDCRILYSQDGGISFKDQIEMITTSPLEDVQFVDDQEGWTVGREVVLHTIDGGASWQAVDPGFVGQWHTVFFTDQRHGWIAGENPSIRDESVLYHTYNGGKDWTELEIPDSMYIHKIFFTDSMHGWMVGESEKVYFTDNGGLDWESHTTKNYRNLDLHFIDSQTGWVIGSCDYRTEDCWRYGKNSQIAKTTDGGATWSYFGRGYTHEFQSIYFSDSLHGWALFGSEGVYYRTQNGGLTWNEQYIPGALLMQDVYFINNEVGWVVDLSANIWYTEDGGSNWTRQEPGTNSGLSAVHAVDEGNAWAVGDNGVILKYTAKSTTSVEEVGTIAKSDISVYPNPAASFLNIVIPESSSTFRAEIGNLLGQKLRSYEVVGPETRIDLQGLPSGIYLLNFYNGSERYTKKFMIVGK